jgi:hypothetical protein
VVEVEKSPASPLPIFWGKSLVNFLYHKIGGKTKKKKEKKNNPRWNHE